MKNLKKKSKTSKNFFNCKITFLKSFTLIEILVVSTIIGLLAAAGIVSYAQFSKEARDAKRKADLEQIRAALEMYRSNNNQYADFTGNCSSYTALTGSTKYLQSMPTDPKATSGLFYYCNISANDYTLGAYLETGSTNVCVAGQCGNYCNYCLGPYGQK